MKPWSHLHALRRGNNLENSSVFQKPKIGILAPMYERKSLNHYLLDVSIKLPVLRIFAPSSKQSATTCTLRQKWGAALQDLVPASSWRPRSYRGHSIIWLVECSCRPAALYLHLHVRSIGRRCRYYPTGSYQWASLTAIIKDNKATKYEGKLGWAANPAPESCLTSLMETIG